jgi:hypothetical protein
VVVASGRQWFQDNEDLSTVGFFVEVGTEILVVLCNADEFERKSRINIRSQSSRQVDDSDGEKWEVITSAG